MLLDEHTEHPRGQFSHFLVSSFDTVDVGQVSTHSFPFKYVINWQAVHSLFEGPVHLLQFALHGEHIPLFG